MDKKLKAKWISALRSGKIRQTTGELVTNSGRAFCCLGVLEKVCGTPKRKILECNGEICIEDENGNLVMRGVSRRLRVRLAKLNDNGKTFPEIADWIKKHVPVSAP